MSADLAALRERIESGDGRAQDAAAVAGWILADETAAMSRQETLGHEMVEARLALVRRRGLGDADRMAEASRELADLASDLDRLSHNPDLAGAERPLTIGPSAIGYTLADLEAHQFPARRALLCRGDEALFREGHTGQIAATRGMGKTWLMQTLALVACSSVEVLGLRAPEPRRVLYIDGEMGADEVQARFLKLRRLLGLALPLPLTVVAADWQEAFLPRLDTADGQEFVERFVAEADLVFLDNRSCLFDPDGEKDAAAWQPAQDYLLSLRRRGKGILVGHHANRQGTARGHSKAEDMLNLSIRLSRPDGYAQGQGARFHVEFDKARGVHGAAVAPFVAALTENGWRLEAADAVEADGARGKIREYLRIADAAGERPRSASAASAGAKVQKSRGLEAWAAMMRAGEITSHPGGGFALA